MAKRKAPKDAKERILEAAVSEFARAGFNGARLARIAKGAKVSSQLLYHYFRSKRGLYQTALETSLSQIQFPKDISVENEPVWFTNSSTPNGKTVFRLMLWEALEDKRGHYVAEATRREAIDSGIETFRRAQANGYFPVAFDPFFLYLTHIALRDLPRIFPQVMQIAGMDPEDPQFLDKWNDHLLSVMNAIRHAVAEPRTECETAPLSPQGSASHQPKKAFTLEEAREMFNELISRASGVELGKRN